MTEVFFLHFARAGDLHPPSFAFFAFEKDYGHVVGHENAELVVVLGVFVWKVVLSPVVSFDEVPEGVRYDLGSASIVVFFLVVVVNSYRGKFVAHACEVEYLAKLLAIEAVRIVAARGVGGSDCSYVGYQHIGVAYERFGLFDLVLYFAQTVYLEFHLVHQIYDFRCHEVCLVGCMGVVEEIVRLVAENVGQIVVHAHLGVQILEVELAVEVEDVYYLSYLFVCLVVSCRHVVVASQDDGYDSVLE